MAPLVVVSTAAAVVVQMAAPVSAGTVIPVV